MTGGVAELRKTHTNLERPAKQMATFDESKSGFIEEQEQNRNTRLDTLDREIKDMVIKVTALEVKERDITASIARKEADFSTSYTTRKRELETMQGELMVREDQVSQREEAIRKHKSNMEEMKAEHIATKKALEKELTEVREQLEDVLESIEAETKEFEELQEKRKQLDRNYAQASNAYANSMATKIRREERLDLRLANIEKKAIDAEKEYAADEKRRKAKLRDIRNKEKLLAQREEKVENESKAVKDRYDTLLSAIEEWKAKGVVVS